MGEGLLTEPFPPRSEIKLMLLLRKPPSGVRSESLGSTRGVPSSLLSPRMLGLAPNRRASQVFLLI